MKSFPLETQEVWDNSGWQIRVGSDFNQIITALSPTLEVVNEAIENNCSLIITHHPLFFHPCNSIDTETSSGHIITTLIQHSISLFSIHTPADKGVGGLADWWVSLLHLENTSPLIPERNNPESGLGRHGLLPQKMTVQEVAQMCVDAGYQVVGIAGNISLRTDRVAVLPGSGASAIEHVNAQTIFITSDISYHQAELAEQRNIALINIPHFTMERPFTEIIAQIGDKTGSPVRISQHEKDFFTYMTT